MEQGAVCLPNILVLTHHGAHDPVCRFTLVWVAQVLSIVLVLPYFTYLFTFLAMESMTLRVLSQGLSSFYVV